MKSIVFDSGPVISLALNNLLWILDPLKKRFNGNFCIPGSVKKEIVDKPLSTKKFRFEALQVLNLIKNRTLEVSEIKDVMKKSFSLLDSANNIFIAHEHPIQILHLGETEGVALSLYLNADAFVIDERTTRVLIEQPKALENLLRHKLHTSIKVNKDNLKRFRNETKNIKIIRSAELAAVAYELGFLDKFILDIPKPKKTLLEGLLWGVKLNGCAISKNELNNIIQLEGKS